jgi:hypothetical protein
MNDTEILTSLRDALKVAVDWQWPISPRLSKQYMDWIDRERQPERRTPEDGRSGQDVVIKSPLLPEHQQDDLKWTDADRRSWFIGTRGVQLSETQRFWRCEHHPSAIDNWDVWREYCEHGCDKSELRWSDNGTHVTPA